MERKFKNGDWVRATRDMCGIKNGDVLRVSGLARPTTLGEWVMIEGKRNSTYDSSYLEERFEPWKPNVGERVRVTEKANSVWAGEGEVLELHASFGTYTIHMHTGYRAGDFGDFLISEIEPLSVSAEAQQAAPERANAGGGFKAGDKIELVDGAIDGVRAIGDVYEAVAHKKTAHDDSVCFVGNNGEVTWAPGSFFKLHVPITIQAGKFYKTRDGRKVGPMLFYINNKSEWMIEVGDGNLWTAEGKHKQGCRTARGEDFMHDGGDIIAEWPADTTTNVAATVDAINDEYGPVLQEVPVLVAAQPAPTMIRTKNGYGFELARAGAYVWVDIGQKAPITVRADTIRSA